MASDDLDESAAALDALQLASDGVDRTQAATAIVSGGSLDHEDRLASFQELATLIEIGLTPTQAVDVYAIDVLDVDRQGWSEVREVDSGLDVMLYNGRAHLMDFLLERDRDGE